MQWSRHQSFLFRCDWPPIKGLWSLKTKFGFGSTVTCREGISTPTTDDDDDVHLTSAADKTDDVVHQTSTGAKTFHVDHAAHGHNNEDQKNFKSRQMRMILNSLHREVQTIQREVQTNQIEV